MLNNGASGDHNKVREEDDNTLVPRDSVTRVSQQQLLRAAFHFRRLTTSIQGINHRPATLRRANTCSYTFETPSSTE